MTSRSHAITWLLKTIVKTPIRFRDAVSRSIPVIPNDASPMTLMHSLSGAASFAPIARPRPEPSCVDFPQPMYEPARVVCQNGKSCSRGEPESCVMMTLSRSTVFIRSPMTRYWLIGTSSLAADLLDERVDHERRVADQSLVGATVFMDIGRIVGRMDHRLALR